ncbi:MAG TPA: helix-turn-helix domain-containing protein [Candidatus Paceibacterota bacterium]|nr:helix-turn-helix domain-containing protein [Candidatus Paceibacterota bacterium]
MNQVIKWQDVSFVISSDYRKRILDNIQSPKTPSKLSKELNINIAHISRTLSELESSKLIECLTPKANKGKLYIITNYGKQILSEINKSQI